jgi:NADPH2:quinone reductase
MKAVRIHKTGGPDQLVYEDVPTPEAGPGEVRVRVDAAGLNFVDIYKRRGLYPLHVPGTLGEEGAGVVDALGEDVQDFQPGERVAFVMHTGSYAEFVVIPEDRLVLIPQDIDTNIAAAAMLQGLTAHFLSRSTFVLKEGHTALIHAAAGGVGILLVQMAKASGARVFGTVSTQEKAQWILDHGADEAIRYTEVDFEGEIERLTDGSGINVVYDSVGRATFEKSLRCLAPRGMLVLYGQASGPVEPFDPLLLSRNGSLFLTRPSLSHYITAQAEYQQRVRELFDMIGSGALKVHIDQEFPLEHTAEAHRYMEDRRTKGKVLLIP